jgi:hypothetical protein
MIMKRALLVGIDNYGRLPTRNTLDGRSPCSPLYCWPAVGRPDEELPEVGALRLYLQHDDWQDSVLRLMAEASQTGLGDFKAAEAQLEKLIPKVSKS